VAGRLSGNNQPEDTPPIFLNTTFDHISAKALSAADLFCSQAPVEVSAYINGHRWRSP